MCVSMVCVCVCVSDWWYGVVCVWCVYVCVCDSRCDLVGVEGEEG